MKSSKSVPKEQVTVVLPTLNEERAIGRVIDELLQEGYNNILVVDGYSTDKTVEIARSKGVKVIFQIGRGKSGAVRTAIDFSQTPYILFMDADHTYDPKDIERLLEYPDCDEVIGMRVDRKNIPILHRIGNKAISSMLSLLMGRRISDPCSGMYLLKTDVARKIPLLSEGFDVEVEIVSFMLNYGRVIEVPISYRKREGTKKLRSFRDGARILLTIVKLAWLYNYVFLLSALGLLLTISGLLMIFWQLFTRYVYGAEKWSLGWSLFGLILLIVGLQGFTVATIILMLKRLERRILSSLH
ncbi:MAG: glycosyltransferase family 2 protein [Candidatus Korarchaeum sp.]